MSGDDQETPPPTNRMVVAVLALMGLFIAFYLTAHALGWTGPLRCGIGSCETVQSSEWATLGPIPVAAIGLVGYLALLVLAVVGIQPAWRGSGLVGGLLLLGSTLALAYSAFLTYLEAFVIRAWCQWCVTSAILVTIIFLASLPEARRMGGGKKS
ncbi:MAG: vitamin K epoxide reductase family protein [Gemmatimonadota bacterium]